MVNLLETDFMPSEESADGHPIPDRLLHHVHIIHIDGRSYRLRELDGLLKQPASSPPNEGGDIKTA